MSLKKMLWCLNHWIPFKQQVKRREWEERGRGGKPKFPFTQKQSPNTELWSYPVEVSFWKYCKFIIPYKVKLIKQ